MEPPMFYRREFEQHCRISRATTYRLIAIGKFPPVTRVGFRGVAWRRGTSTVGYREEVEPPGADP